MTDTQTQPQKDKPWLIRTYAGHSTAQASNALYRGNLAKGQTGLSVAWATCARCSIRFHSSR